MVALMCVTHARQRLVEQCYLQTVPHRHWTEECVNSEQCTTAHPCTQDQLKAEQKWVRLMNGCEWQLQQHYLEESQPEPQVVHLPFPTKLKEREALYDAYLTG